MVHKINQGSESIEKTLTLVGIGGKKEVFEIVGLKPRGPRRGVWFEGKRTRSDHFLRNSGGVGSLALWDIWRVGLRMFRRQGSKNFIGVVSKTFR